MRSTARSMDLVAVVALLGTASVIAIAAPQASAGTAAAPAAQPSGTSSTY